MAAMTPRFSNPKAIAQAGEEIYNRKYRSDFEANQVGKFAAINVKNERCYLGNTPEAALESAKEADPDGLFHLIRIGFTGAFQVSYAFQKTSSDWLFG